MDSQEMTVDGAKMEAFVGKVLGDTSGLVSTLMAHIGDRLGLFEDLAARGPATSAELAARTGLSERHVREWLKAMTAAGYLERTDGGERFVLPPEHAAVLAQEGGPVFFGGVHEEFVHLAQPIDRVVETFRTGGGVPQHAYPDRAYEGMDRFTATWFENLLLPVWIPAAGLKEKLEAGIDVADVGCGRGRALIKLAQAFPRSRFVGYEVYAPNVERARANVAEAGLADRIRIEQRDVTQGIPETFDLITTFDVVHDAVDPVGLLRAIRRSLRDGGKYLCLDINCSPSLDDHLGPVGALLLGCSVLYCMQASLAHGGAGLGTCGLHPHELERIAASAGFGAVRKLPLDNPFNNLYELTP